MNNKKIYETPVMKVTKFEVDKEIMAGEQNTDEWIEIDTKPYESATTAPDIDWDL